MKLDKNFNEFVELFVAKDVHSLVVGGYALAAHGYPRATDDVTALDQVVQLGYRPYAVHRASSHHDALTIWCHHANDDRPRR